MARRLAAALGLLLVIFAALLFWPVVMTYTFVAGEKATASVTNCETIRNNKSTDTTCTGTWRTEGGDTGSGEIYGLDEDQEGDTVPVRIGPMGPYAGGFGHSWVLFLTAVPALLAPVVVAFSLGPFFSRNRRLARSLLAEPGGGRLVIVTRDAVTHADGSPFATVRKAESPPAGYRRAEVPGRPFRGHQRSVFEAVAGINRDATEFTAVVGTAGRPLMFVEARTSKELETECVLLDAAGAALVVVRRLSAYPLHYSLLSPAGEAIGSARPAVGKLGGNLLIRDAGGLPVATAATSGRRWVVRVESRASSLLRDAALALALIQLRSD
ncbi:hypothetical protein [Actinomadura sp. 6K520]|uniref:hypothetical protein n=1 Tax=Actinomadura sp. 6K520 TaxID=2530364 RepID=UPI00105360D6|nr:hypothetical protein [Actinomadura sp. 6K520]TDE33010.1 hypothetical protein E1289_13685 [Actinomadura sp. 6K520]